MRPQIAIPVALCASALSLVFGPFGGPLGPGGAERRAVAHAPGRAHTHGPSERLTRYTIRVRLDPKKRELDGSLLLSWKNPSKRSVPSLRFHLYLNAFKNDATIFLRHPQPFRDKTKGKRTYGWIKVEDLLVGGVKPRQVEHEHDGTVLRVDLAQPVDPQGVAQVKLRFRAKLPKVIARSGYYEKFHMVAQWFPKIAVLEPDGTWNCHPYYPNSEYYANFGVYRVTMEVPRGYGVAASGRRLSRKPQGKHAVFTHLAEDVHDFAWAAAPKLKTATRNADGVLLKVAHLGADKRYVERTLDAMAKSLALLAQWIGRYPYPVLTAVVVPPGAEAAGGMEYPTLFTTGTPDDDPIARYLRSDLEGIETTVHELVHQYFYGLLASNEFEEAWLDEGFTSYVTGLIMNAMYGADRSGLDVGPFRIGYFRAWRIFFYSARSGLDPARLAAWRFAGSFSYFANVYGKTALTLRTVERYIGTKRMHRLLADYFRRFRFAHPRGEDFFRLFDKHVKERYLRRFLRQSINEANVLDYRVRSISNRKQPKKPKGIYDTPLDRRRRDALIKERPGKYVSEVLLQRTGELRLPVEIHLRRADGSRVKRWWDGESRWHRLTLSHRSRITRVHLDPHRRMALERRILDNALSTRSDHGAARRMTGRVLMALQMALGVVGF